MTQQAPHWLFLLPAAAWACTMLLTALLIPLLARGRMLDTPNARSNHSAPVPRGGGIALLGAALPCLLALQLHWLLLAACFLLALVSFFDDRRPLPAKVRFIAQVVAVGLALPLLPGRVLPGFIPLPVEYILLALGWIWFINLTNFMDGINGISALHTATSCGGIVLVYYGTQGFPLQLALGAAVLAGGMLGFYRFNVTPAKIFLGDVGSVPLGFLSGFFLLCLASYGYWAAALLLPAYYLADATSTLLLRLSRGERVWEAHSSHAYQRAVRAGMSHEAVSGRIGLLGLLLAGLALLSAHSMMAAILCCAAGYGAVFLLIYRFRHAPVRP